MEAKDKAIAAALNRIKKQGAQVNIQALYKALLTGEKSALAKAITLLESSNNQHITQAQELLNLCLPHAGNSERIGITGVPGVGKSTFIESFGNYLTKKGHKIAVLAVDPSSQKSKGSILGDKTRMETLAQNPDAYIRPSASGDSLGGVTRKTREAIVLCEAAGYDTIIIETVGVGQSETAVKSMVDYFLLLMLAGAGDELQGIKRGIMEMADSLIITKADSGNEQNAKNAEVEYRRAMHLLPPSNVKSWTPVVGSCSSLNNTGFDKIYQTQSAFFSLIKKNGFYAKNRQEQAKSWMFASLKDQLFDDLKANPAVKSKLHEIETAVQNGAQTPHQGAEAIFKLYRG